MSPAGTIISSQITVTFLLERNRDIAAQDVRQRGPGRILSLRQISIGRVERSACHA